MKVFCLVECDDEYGHRDLLAVFSSHELALAYAAREYPDKLVLSEPPRQWGPNNWEFGLMVLAEIIDEGIQSESE